MTQEAWPGAGKPRETEVAELVGRYEEIKTYVDIVVHDFRAPLVNLKGFSQEISRSLDDLRNIIDQVKDNTPLHVQKAMKDIMEDEIPETLKFLNSALNRMARMVSSMSELARLGRRKLISEEVDMADVVNLVLTSFSYQIEQKGIRIEVEPLPVIHTDRVAVEQIVANLVDNSIKYIDANRPGEIKFHYVDNGDEIGFYICDNGRGMAPEDQNKIFDLFWRGCNQDVPGDGMGLAYIVALLRRLGGKAGCKSAPGVGTEMILTLPKELPSELL